MVSFDPAARAQQPEHTAFRPTLWDWDPDGVGGTATRMGQLCIHALLVQLYASYLVAEVEVPPAPGTKGFGCPTALGYGPSEDSLRRPVWLGKDYYQLQRQAGAAQRGFWRYLSPLAGPVAGPLEWVEPVVG